MISIDLDPKKSQQTPTKPTSTIHQDDQKHEHLSNLEVQSAGCPEAASSQALGDHLQTLKDSDSALAGCQLVRRQNPDFLGCEKPLIQNTFDADFGEIPGSWVVLTTCLIIYEL
eukprot:s992_g22.t1